VPGNQWGPAWRPWGRGTVQYGWAGVGVCWPSDKAATGRRMVLAAMCGSLGLDDLSTMLQMLPQLQSQPQI
jgi:hypothetical protein